MGVFLGFDPGGAGAFGWCVLDGNALPLNLRARGIANHAHDALNGALQAAGNNAIDAVGIDAPLFWRSDGDRQVDQVTRTQIVGLGSPGGTVNHVNSMRGACLIQGVAVGLLTRQLVRPDVPISEAHPKAMLWLLGVASPANPPENISLADLPGYFVGNVQGASDHERDAAVGALSAFAMVNQLQNWHDLFQHEVNPLLPLQQPLGYWMPV